MNLESYLKKNVKPTYFNTGWWLGDGFCDDDLNNEECNWDNGDLILHWLPQYQVVF